MEQDWDSLQGDGTLRDEFTAEITEAILREHYDENVDKFKVQSWAPKLRATYVYFPYESLKETFRSSSSVR